MPESDFLKQLIALLAQSGGLVSLPLADLQQLGVEITLQSLGSSSPTLTFRLGAKIYYVPAAQESTWPATSSTLPTSPNPTNISDEINAVNQLNNRLNRSLAPKLPISPEIIESDTLPQHKPLHKTDLDAFLAEQRQSTTRASRAEREKLAIRNKSRPLPWETRKTQ